MKNQKKNKNNFLIGFTSILLYPLITSMYNDKKIINSGSEMLLKTENIEILKRKTFKNNLEHIFNPFANLNNYNQIILIKEKFEKQITKTYVFENLETLTQLNNILNKENYNMRNNLIGYSAINKNKIHNSKDIDLDIKYSKKRLKTILDNYFINNNN